MNVAEQKLREAEELKQLDSGEYLARHELYWGMLEYLRSNNRDSISHLQRAEILAVGFPKQLAIINNFLAINLTQIGMPNESLEAFEKALEFTEQSNQTLIRRNIRCNIAYLQLELGRVEQAKIAYEALTPVNPDDFQFVSIYSGLAKIAIRQKRFSDARTIIADCLSRYRQKLTEPFEIGGLKILLAEADLYEGNLKQAMKNCDLGLSMMDNKRHRGNGTLIKGEILFRLGKHKEGEELLKSIADSDFPPSTRITAYDKLVELSKNNKEFEKGIVYLEAVTKLREESQLVKFEITEANLNNQMEKERLEKIAEQQRLNAEKAQHENELLQKQAKAYQWGRNVVIVGSILAILGFLSYFQSEYRHQQIQLQLEESEKRSRLQQQIEQKKRLEAIGKLTGNVAHDFNNILQIISQSTELLDDSFPDEHRAKNQSTAMQLLADSVRVGSKITEQLLTFARKQAVEPVDTSMGDLFENSGLLFKSVGGERIAVEIDVANPTDMIHVDKSQFSNAILNLLLNARDAIDDSGLIKINVSRHERELDTLAIEGSVRVDVIDDGVGMSISTRQQAFEPFFSTKEPGTGTGLGLSSVRGFVEQANGQIEVESQLDVGTCVSLYFPLVATEFTTMPSNSHGSNEFKTLIDSRPGLKCLVVDDNLCISKSLVKMLESRGYQAESCESADSARKIIQNDWTFDVIISDVVMPGEWSGFDLVQWLQEKDEPPATIIVSGNASPMPQSDVVFLRKPFSLDQLLDAIQQSLKKNLLTG